MHQPHNGIPEWVIFNAFRYALGRVSYVVNATTVFLTLMLVDLQTQTLQLMLRDIEEAAGRGALGHTCDVNDWLWLREDIIAELEGRV